VLRARLFTLVATAFLANALFLTGCVHTPPFRDANGVIIPGSIASMETIRINGVPQAVWFRGRDAHLPILILLHGGPGISEGALFRHFNSELENHFLVVTWEQRGAGRSFRPDIPPASMTIAQFVRDLDALVEIVRERFDAPRVALLGHSWGSALGILYAHQFPEKISAFIGTGQVASTPDGDLHSYRFACETATERNESRAIRKLRELGMPPYSVEERLWLGRLVERYGGMIRGGLTTGKLVLAALGEPEASLWDLVQFGRGNKFSLEHLWPEFSQLRLNQEYTRFEVPVFFILGRHDRHVPAVLAADYFEKIDAPVKRLFWLDRSAHHPPFEEPDVFNRILIQHIAPGISQRGVRWRTHRRLEHGATEHGS
jgi:proline iminopeptidase